MKSFEGLTRLGKIRRMQQVAQAALKAYGVVDAHPQFLRQAGNTLFRVHAVDPVPDSGDELYARGQYLLRIHQPGYQTSESLELELTWLSAMCREANLPVPEPVQTRAGSLLAQVCLPGVPGERSCSLLRWLKGREIKTGAGPRHYQAQGQLMGRLHQFAARWQPPAGLSKRKYDWDGLFWDDAGVGLLAGEAWTLLPQPYCGPFEEVARRLKQVMDGWGTGPEVYGLIHADLGLDANVLFWKGAARAIDFDDSGFGYYLYDLSLALEHCQDDEDLPRFREALLDGYTRVRPLPADQIRQIDLFLAGFCVYLSLWAAAMIQVYPPHAEELSRRMERAFRLVDRYLGRG